MSGAVMPMTPDERERLVRVEVGMQHLSEAIDRVEASQVMMRAELAQLIKAANIGQGIVLSTVKIGGMLSAAAAFIVGVAGFIGWLVEKGFFRKWGV